MQKEQYFNVFMYEKNLFGQDSMYLNVNFLGGFIPCKAEQPLKCMEYKKKKHKKIKAYRKFLLKEATVNSCLLILNLKAFRL